MDQQVQEALNQQLRDIEKKALRRFHREEDFKPYQAELIRMQRYLEERGTRMIILFEGRGAAGKGGTIRRVTRYMNEKHYRVVALGAAGKGGTIRRVTRYMNEKHYRVVALAKPTEQEKTQWFYQRYIRQFPRGGEIVLFDRSWYTRAIVEPVFGFCTDQQYRDFMHSVTGFEKDLVRQGTVLVKLYFSVTREEQEHRFNSRKTDPLHQWKLREVDAQAQERWDDFTRAKYEMLKKTHTTHAPWKVIRSIDKHQARLNAIKVILNSVPYERLNTELDFVPDPALVISGSRELENMAEQHLHNA